MQSMNWKDVAELVGISAIVGSLLFVGLQMRQAQDIARTELGMSVLSAELGVLSALNDRAEIWNKGIAGEELNRDEQLVFNNLLKALEAESFWEYRQWERLNTGDIRINIPIHDFARILHQNQGARAAWLALKEKRQRYETLHAEPLEGNSFDEKLEEILQMQDQL